MLTLLIAPLFVGAPVPKDKPAVYYTAVKVGDRREYRTADGTPYETFVVTKVVESPGGGLLVTEATADGDKLTPFRVLLVTEDVVALKEGLAIPATYDPPQVWVRPKAKPSDKWEHTVPGSADVWRYTAGEPERVTTPAGTFDTVRVELVTRDFDQTFWYAPGVGVVKRTGKRAASGDSFLLHSFTRGK